LVSSDSTLKPRVIRIFVSSTFRDMQAERNELVKNVFPNLRKLCEQRSVTWGEVDLRWGITDEEKAEGKVLPICLEVIKDCRPFFIGILGERYGWVDEEISKVALERYEWLKDYSGKSITEVEILHGVLRDPEMADNAFFYFRDPAYAQRKEKDEPGNYLETSTKDEIIRYGVKEAEKRAEERRLNLQHLKDSIRKSKFKPKENFSDPKTLGKLILNDFTNVINQLYPVEENINPLDQALFDHEAFAESRFGFYIKNDELCNALDAHASGNCQPLVIVGESGSGKSALLANWARKYYEKHNDNFTLVHFIGATPDSVDCESMLRRIMGELKRHFNIQQEIPEKPDELKKNFANWLHMATARGKTIMIIDALNQLDDRDGAPDLFWLPEQIPTNVRLIVSTLPGRSLEALKKRGWPILKVKPLDLFERKKLIDVYLKKQYNKSLSSTMVEYIASHDQVGNPLFLRALLEEIRLCSDHKKLQEMIEHYLGAGSIDELYSKILDRLAEDYEGERKNLVKDATCLIWSSRKGLSDAELLDLLGSNGEQLPGAFWYPFYLAVERSLVSRGGLLNFSHEYIANAIRKKYLSIESNEQHYHIILANYFDKRETSKRKVEEYPWQLAKAKSWDRLSDILVDQQFFITAWNANQLDVKRYWTQVENNSQIKMIEAYRNTIDTPSQYDKTFIFSISNLFIDTGHFFESFLLVDYLEEYYRRNNDHQNLLGCLLSQAANLKARGKYDSAMKLYIDAERICFKLNNPVGLSNCLFNEALILELKGDLDNAMNLYEYVEKIYREFSIQDGLAACHGSKASILKNKGDLEGAMKLYKEQEKICRELSNQEGLSTCLGNEALILQLKRDFDGAMELHKEEERICRELNNPDGLQRSLGNQAVCLRLIGKLDDSMKLLKEKERICRELNNPRSLQKSLGDQAVILQLKGDLDGAMNLHKEQEKICRELNYPEGLQACLGEQALILRSKGDLYDAMTLLKEQEKICLDLKNPYGLVLSYINRAYILMELNLCKNALPIAEEALKIANNHGYIALVKEIQPNIEIMRIICSSKDI
jgi:tetratricopeptide (TPR) repeat protein